MDTLKLGDVTITRVIEIGRSFFPTASMLPDSSADVIARHRPWLAPFWDDATGDIGSRIQSWIVRTPDHTVLIDTGVGNDKHRDESPLWHMRQSGFLDDLAAAGAKPEEIDLVVCTHLHVDHVGWNTRLVDGRWVPTFPRATYLFVGQEWEFWNDERRAGREPYGCVEDSVLPIVEAGRARLAGSTDVIDDWLAFEPWPGHTPGHAGVRVRPYGRNTPTSSSASTDQGDAIFAGDVMHRVVQVAEPQWSSRFCSDPAHAARTRREFVERHAGTGTLVIAAHFPLPGRIVRRDSGCRFDPIAFGG